MVKCCRSPVLFLAEVRMVSILVFDFSLFHLFLVHNAVANTYLLYRHHLHCIHVDGNARIY